MSAHAPSDAVRQRLIGSPTFQISVDVATIAQGLGVAEAALAGGVDIVEMGTPLLKSDGVTHVVPAFRRAFPDALLLADMKTMDGGAFEARSVYAGGANIIDFLALAGVATSLDICAVRDEFRAAEPNMPRLAFADILLPHQGPADAVVAVARSMLEAGVDGVGIHLQLDARRADPTRYYQTPYLGEIAAALHRAVGDRASVQVVGGLSIAQAQALARQGLRAFVISGNLGHADARARYDLPPAELTAQVSRFIAEVRGI